MTTKIKLNLNVKTEEWKNAKPRLKQGLENIAARHNATGLIRIQTNGYSNAQINIYYMSGALLRDVVSYLDEMSVLD